MDERIILNNVSKKFKIGAIKNKSALSSFISLFSGREPKKEFFVLKNISLSVKSGESLGVIGRNGSGKSTLLRVIAGIYGINNGFIRMHGKMIYLTGFGFGLNHRLTMRENIFLIGAVMGLSYKEIKNRFEDIVEFSGLREYLDTKVYQFSSGMVARLSVSATLFCVSHTNPDILLIDEAFSGGADIDFQEKSIKKMEELIKKGAAVIFVSHDLESIKKYCDKAILLDKGEIIKEGKSKEVVDYYIRNN